MSTGSSDTLERVSTRLHAVQTSARARRRRMKRETDGVRSSMVWLNQGCGDGPQLAKSLGRCQVCGGVDSLPVSATRRDAAHLITAARRKETRSSDGSGGERPVCTRPRETSRADLTHQDTYKKKKKRKSIGRKGGQATTSTPGSTVMDRKQAGTQCRIRDRTQA